MIKVRINKQRDFYDCSVFEDKKFTGQGARFTSADEAKSFKQMMEQQDLSAAVPSAAVPSAVSVATASSEQVTQVTQATPEQVIPEEDGQMSFI